MPSVSPATGPAKHETGRHRIAKPKLKSSRRAADNHSGRLPCSCGGLRRPIRRRPHLPSSWRTHPFLHFRRRLCHCPASSSSTTLPRYAA
ncbi:hypothetical protein CBM2589_A10080 [Cupriavidus taiwanensis]|uniref:Uncharacterized protein n=1 Tax=Cupriavidus taiwanensis TaxID=164546 RepID=A0A976A3G2_9BURK|nr:hypothetical protein CBM2589_A10080 [Cupriavidus taiwanensis]